MNDRNWIHDVLQQYEQPLLRYCLRLTGGDLETAREIVQEAFLKLCRAERAKLEDSPGAWLYAVCRNRVMDLKRKEQRMKAKRGALALETGLGRPSAEAAPETEAERREAMSQVQRAMLELSEKQQEVLRLRFQAGLSYKEIGQVTGDTVNHVGVTLHTAIKNLRQKLADEVPAAGPTASPRSAS